ncbi:MAG: hypothetical protein M1816_005469 [Peltula sp. TS41687]|nr:MAG: hypothetical protein M1816_005469 [Peltula sp. TS41687]
MEDSNLEVVDLRALDFTSSIDANLICSVCHCPFIKPTITAECEHIFCAECFESSTSQQPGTCPFCRTKIDKRKARRAPRVLSNMADDLKVKCPLQGQGCDAILMRGAVQSHVEKYCGHVEVECPGTDCVLKTARKDLGLGCRHHLVVCQDCHDSVMAMNLEEHREKRCTNRWTSCAECKAEILQCKREDHGSTCSEAIVECPGKSIGCAAKTKRSELEGHTGTCMRAGMAPIFQKQDERIKALEEKALAKNNSLKRRMIATLGAVLATTSPPSSQQGNATTGFDSGFPSVASSPIVDDAADAETGVDPVSPTSASSGSSSFDPAVQHLLSSYESLRLDIDRIVASINELDARQSMMIVNESLRVKEDFSHLNAVVGAMRIQLHWLMTTRLQSQQRAGTMAGSSNSSNGAGNAGYGNAGSSLNTMGSQALRRLSDAIRQDTKL